MNRYLALFILLPFVASAQTVKAETPQPRYPNCDALMATERPELMPQNKVSIKGNTISLKLKDADIRAVLGCLGERYHLNVVVHGDVKGKVSIAVKAANVHEAFNAVIKQQGLVKWKKGEVIFVSPAEALFDDGGGCVLKPQNLEPMIQQLIFIKHRKAKDVMQMIKEKKMLSKRGRVAMDRKTNVIIVNDVLPAVDKIKAFVEQIDIPNS